MLGFQTRGKWIVKPSDGSKLRGKIFAVGDGNKEIAYGWLETSGSLWA